MRLHDILQLLNSVQRRGEGYTAKCPAHDDSSPSLSIRQKDNRILVHCFAGCTLQDISDALSLKIQNWFEDTELPATIRAAMNERLLEMEALARRNQMLHIEVDAMGLELRKRDEGKIGIGDLVNQKRLTEEAALNLLNGIYHGVDECSANDYTAWPYSELEDEWLKKVRLIKTERIKPDPMTYAEQKAWKAKLTKYIETQYARTASRKDEER
jgi:hypothetical protein